MAASEPAQPTQRAERERISRALIDLCYEHGYRHTTLLMLLERATVDQATFERHFADLEDCFCEVFQELTNEYLLRVGVVYAAEQGWRNQLRAATYEGLRFLREDLPRARFLYIEVLSAGTRAQLVRDRNMEAMYDLVDLARQELDDPDSIPRSTAVSLAGGIYERLHVTIDRDDPRTWVARVPEFMYMLVLPYFGPEAALEELSIPVPDDLYGSIQLIQESSAGFGSQGEEREATAERDRICRALIDLCYEHGYRNTTLPMVLERATVDQATFERHFADLEDCFCEVFQELSNHYLLRLGSAFATEQNWREQMRAASYASLRFLREDLPRARFLFIEVLFAGTRAQLVRDQNMEALYELVDLGRRELDDPDSVSRDTAVSIAGGIYERMHVAIDRDDREVWETLVPEFMYTLVLPYLGAEVALEELSIPPPEKLEGKALG